MTAGIGSSCDSSVSAAFLWTSEGVHSLLQSSPHSPEFGWRYAVAFGDVSADGSWEIEVGQYAGAEWIVSHLPEGGVIGESIALLILVAKSFSGLVFLAWDYGWDED